MATTFRLTLIAPQEYNVEQFDLDANIWDETDPSKTTAREILQIPIVTQ